MLLAGGTGIAPMFQVWVLQVNGAGAFCFTCRPSASFLGLLIAFVLNLLLKVTKAMLENPIDNNKVHLIYANVTYEDILLKVKHSLSLS